MKWSRKMIPIIDVLKSCDAFHSEGFESKNGLERLKDKFNCPEKVAFAAIERDIGNELLNYGTSIRTAWVTEQGKQLLKQIEI